MEAIMFPRDAFRNKNISATRAIVLMATLMGSMAIGGAKAAESIQFSDLQGVHDWRKVSNAVVLVQGKNLQWYEALLDAACMKYDTSGGVRFITEAGGTNEPARVSKVIVGQRICNVTSLTPAKNPDAKSP